MFACRYLQYRDLVSHWKSCASEKMIEDALLCAEPFLGLLDSMRHKDVDRFVGFTNASVIGSIIANDIAGKNTTNVCQRVTGRRARLDPIHNATASGLFNRLAIGDFYSLVGCVQHDDTCPTTTMELPPLPPPPTTTTVSSPPTTNASIQDETDLVERDLRDHLLSGGLSHQDFCVERRHYHFGSGSNDPVASTLFYHRLDGKTGAPVLATRRLPFDHDACRYMLLAFGPPPFSQQRQEPECDNPNEECAQRSARSSSHSFAYTDWCIFSTTPQNVNRIIHRMLCWRRHGFLFRPY